MPPCLGQFIAFEWQCARDNLAWTMTITRLLFAVLITMLSVLATSAGGDEYSWGPPSLANEAVMVLQASESCDHCGSHQSVDCLQLCTTSLPAVLDGTSVHRPDATDASFGPRAELLREGRVPLPRLTPPIA